jgi:hypothetical protein
MPREWAFARFDHVAISHGSGPTRLLHHRCLQVAALALLSGLTAGCSDQTGVGDGTGATAGSGATAGAASGGSSGSGTGVGGGCTTAGTFGGGTGGGTSGGSGGGAGAGAAGGSAGTAGTGAGTGGGAGAGGGAGTAGSSGGGSGGTAGAAGSGGTAGSSGTTGGGGAGGALVWPNEESSTNSDTWLVEHHDRITKLEPRVLLVNFADGVTEQEAIDKAEAIIGAVAEGSRHHGYSNDAAPVFIEPKIAHVVDMPGQPLRSGNHFGYVEFMTGQNFASQMAFTAPGGSENLTVCEMFEQGFINEAWVVETANDNAKLYEQKTLGQRYDANFQKLEGQLDRCAGNGCIEDTFSCGVTVRLHEVNPDRGPGCATHAWGHGIESQVKTRQIPYFTANASRFFNFDLDERHDTPFGDFYICPYNTQTCIEYVTSTHLRNGPASPQSFDIPEFGDGCGNVHFAPHSRYQYDYENGATGTGRATCEGYGLSTETQTDISYSTYSALNQNRAYNDCGGGWQIYMRQSFPGYANTARDVDGNPMKNWWPFLYY